MQQASAACIGLAAMIAIRGLAAAAVLGTAALAFHPHVAAKVGAPLAGVDLAHADHAGIAAPKTGRPGDSSRMLAAR